MTVTGKQQRAPKGTPVGGQFSGTQHDEPDVSLSKVGSLPKFDDTVSQICNAMDSWEGEPAVDSAAIGRLVTWESWAHDRFNATGDPYFEQFRSGLSVAPVVMAAGVTGDDSYAEHYEGELEAWYATGTVQRSERQSACRSLLDQPHYHSPSTAFATASERSPSDPAQRGLIAGCAVLSNLDNPDHDDLPEFYSLHDKLVTEDWPGQVPTKGDAR